MYRSTSSSTHTWLCGLVRLRLQPHFGQRRYYSGMLCSSRADSVARVTRSTGDSVPGARGTVCLGSSFFLNTCVRVCVCGFPRSLTPPALLCDLFRCFLYVVFLLCWQAWTRDAGQLSALCDVDAGCAGFNSNGWMKSDVSRRVSSPGTTLWVKSAKVNVMAQNSTGVAIVREAAKTQQSASGSPESIYSKARPRPRTPQAPGERHFRLSAAKA